MKYAVYTMLLLISLSLASAATPLLDTQGRLRNYTTNADISGSFSYNETFYTDSGTHIFSDAGTITAVGGIFNYITTQTINVYSWYDQWAISNYLTKKIKIGTEVSSAVNITAVPLAIISSISNDTKFMAGVNASLWTLDSELNNGTIIRNTNTSWVRNQFSGSTNITIDGNGVISFNGTLTSGTMDYSVVQNSSSHQCPTGQYAYSRLQNGTFLCRADTDTNTYNSTSDIWTVANNGTLASVNLVNTNIGNNYTVLNARDNAINTSANIQGFVPEAFIKAFGFNLTTELKTYFDTLYQATGSYFTQAQVNTLNTDINTSITTVNNRYSSIGNWTNDKTSYYTQTQTNTLNADINTSIGTKVANLTDVKFNQVNSTGNATFNGFHIDKYNSTHYRLWGE